MARIGKKVILAEALVTGERKLTPDFSVICAPTVKTGCLCNMRVGQRQNALLTVSQNDDFQKGGPRQYVVQRCKSHFSASCGASLILKQ